MTAKLTEDDVRDALMGFHKLLLEEADPRMVADAMLTVATAAKVQAYGMVDTARHLWVFSREIFKHPRSHEEAAAMEEASNDNSARH